MAFVAIAVLALCTFAALAIGYYAGRNIGNDAIITNTTQQVQRQIDETHKIQECSLAFLGLNADQRAKLTAQRIEDVCHIDAAHVLDIRNQLTQQ